MNESRGAFRLLTLAGIPIKIHWTFSLLLAWLGYVVYSEGLAYSQAMFFFLLILGLFTCVIAHEYGHALVARRYGIPTRDIFILPIGGLARLEYLPPEPKKEMIIAIAGPLVNLLIALLLSSILWVTGEISFWKDIRSFDDLLRPHGLLFALLFLNLMLFLFNLIPAYPMDGGRIVRSMLSIYYGKRKATIWVSYLAQVIGIVFFLVGTYWTRPTLALIGVFVFFTSAWERRSLAQRAIQEEE